MLDDHIYSSDERIEETEANQWLDALVFGDGALSGVIVSLGRDVHLLSRHFGFSEQVIKFAMVRRGL